MLGNTKTGKCLFTISFPSGPSCISLCRTQLLHKRRTQHFAPAVPRRYESHSCLCNFTVLRLAQAIPTLLTSHTSLSHYPLKHSSTSYHVLTSHLFVTFNTRKPTQQSFAPPIQHNTTLLTRDNTSQYCADADSRSLFINPAILREITRR